MKLDDASLSAIVYADSVEKSSAGRNVDDRYSTLAQKLDDYCSELRKCGVTHHLLWEEYRKEYPPDMVQVFWWRDGMWETWTHHASSLQT